VAKGVCVACVTSADCGEGLWCGTDGQCRPDVCAGKACGTQKLFACNGDGSAYKPGVTCDDNNVCTDNACDAKSLTCFFTANTLPCEDGNACTFGEGCKGGVCSGGQSITCLDPNPCTTDGCDPTSGCTHVNSSAPCDDANPCTTADTCNGGACGGTPASCDDANACTDDACDPTSGCAHATNGAACSSGDACGQCSGGACTTGPIVWDQVYGYGGADVIYGVVDAPGGGYAFAGSITAQGTSTTDAWFGRVDASGTLTVGMKYGATGNDFARALAAASTGGYFIVGARTGNGTGLDGYVVRLNADGYLLWEKAYYGKGNEQFNAVVPTQAGGFVAGGRFDSGSNGSNAIVAGYDANGNVQWSSPKLGVANGFDEVLGLASVAAGGWIATGYVADGAGGGHAFLVRIAANGTKSWQHQYGAGWYDEGAAVLSLGDGFIVVGSRQATSGGPFELRVFRTDTNGTQLWNKHYGSGTPVRGRAIVALASGGFALLGYTAAQGAGKNDLWLLRTDTNGALQFDRTHGGAQDDNGYGLLALSDGFLLAGSTASKGSGGGGWLVRTDVWGFASCAASGVCASLAPAACDDGKPCTADACDPIAGCTHLPIPGCGAVP